MIGNIGVSDPIAMLLGNWSVGISLGSVCLRLLLSVCFGSVIGCERATKRHAAGLRTFILVFMAAASAMMLDVSLNPELQFPLISAVSVLGVAIISSNSLLYTSKSQIKGLTTSMGLWSSSIVGVAIGAGLYTIALLGFIAQLFSLSVFPKFETYLKNRSNHFEIHMELKSRSHLQDFVSTIRELGLKIDDIESNPAYINSGLSVYSVSVTIVSKELKKYKTHDEIIHALSTLEYVSYIDELS